MNKILTDSLKKLFAKRDDNSHKGMFGHALIIGGSENYVGAPQFSLSGTENIITSLSDTVMLSGAGTSAILVPDFLRDNLYANVKFSAIYSCETENGCIKFNQNIIDQALNKTSCCGIGMGMGNGESDKIVRHILNSSSSFLVVDADALKKCKDFDFSGRAVLTPHIGEFSNMTGISKDEIIIDPVSHALRYADDHDCVVVLKSHNSVVTDGKTVYINETGNSKLSKGGSGDILSGIICGLLAFSKDPFASAVAGSYILGRCAEITDVNEFSCLPSDIVREIPKVITEIISRIHNI
ncbi:MAG: NAD(P)H-hydrate dehydratase [Clostridia bacterium]|nr:NAD(P)H-hydrate dehydratase [Clostridia bacterium]